LLGALTVSVASADSLTVVNPNFSNVAVQCGAGYAYESYMSGTCDTIASFPQQALNGGVGIGWTFASNPSGSDGDGVTNPNTQFNPPSFSGLAFDSAAFLQGTTGQIGQAITGFVPGGIYTLSFYVGSRYASAPTYDGNQTVRVMVGGQALGAWDLVSFTPFTLETANFTAVDGGSNILKFAGLVSGDHTAFFSGVSIETTSSLTVSPSTGVPGTGVLASAGGFAPLETVNLVAYASAPATIGTTTANASGVVNLEGHLPQTPFGACGLQAVGQSSGTVASGIISVRPFLSVSPSTGAVGQTVTVTGFGFAAGEEIGVAWPNPPTSLGSATANKNGTFSAQFAIPSGAAVGTDEVVARGQRTGAVAAAQITVE
jgi:hypothetical protein